MAAGTFYFCLAIVVLSLPGELWASPHVKCPAVCHCLGSMVDCNKQGLSEVPSDLPSWVNILDLRSNAIKQLSVDAFKGLNDLEELDLTNNQLKSVNTSIFQHLPKLRQLKISYNHLSEIPNFGRTVNISHLILHHNRIHSINKISLEWLPKLRVLDLNYNRIVDMLPGSFPAMPSLHQLFLNNNKIISLEIGSLDNLTNLEWLKLSKNKLQVLPKDVFRNLTNLRHLELNRNKIRVVEGLTFHGLDKLQILKLRKNNISALMDGAFWGLNKIQNLQMDYNKIKAVTSGWLYGLSSLQQLSLAHNLIDKVDPAGWQFCEQLFELDLTHNHITRIEANTFSDLPHIKYLYLDHNRVSFISDSSFSRLVALHTLDMNYNEISWTISNMNGVFSGLTTLNRLGLDSNHIQSIAKKAFSGLTKLRQLHLVDNAITSVQSNAFSAMTALEELRFNSTSLLCDCQLAWLPKWLEYAGFKNSVTAECGHPQHLKGRSIFSIKPEEFRCDDVPVPVILSQPDSQMALKGNNVSLTCTAASSSNSGTQLSFEWRKNNRKLEDAMITSYSSTGNGSMVKGTTVLHLVDIDGTDSGDYQCVIANRLGRTFSDYATLTVHVFPKFTKVPKPMTVKAGTTVKLECAAEGQPEPEISWKKDGGDDFPAARERRMHVMPDDAVYFIGNVKASDQGTYTCMASSVAGTVTANVTLTVLEMPTFLKKMESKETRQGDTTVLQCMAAGSPKPKLRWLKDGEPLQETPRHFFAASRQLLIIVETNANDAGTYTCEMMNNLGMESDSAELAVVQVPRARGGNTGKQSGGNSDLDDQSTTTGIIVIAVVCCVVGTSLLWVIIIYQTRKKNVEYNSTPTDDTTLPGDMLPYGDGRASPDNTQSTECNGYPAYGIYHQRTAAIFPSDVDDDDHRQSVPLTMDEQPTAEASDNSLNALHRLRCGDSSDSSSSSSSGRSSRHGSGTLMTFQQVPANYAAMVQCPSTAAVVHMVPSGTGGSPQYVHTLETRLPSEHHGAQPPGSMSDGHYDNLLQPSATFPRICQSRPTSEGMLTPDVKERPASCQTPYPAYIHHHPHHQHHKHHPHLQHHHHHQSSHSACPCTNCHASNTDISSPSSLSSPHEGNYQHVDQNSTSTAAIPNSHIPGPYRDDNSPEGTTSLPHRTPHV